MYKQIKGYPLYECDGTTVRNIKTKQVQNIKKGTCKYYLLNAEGKRKLIALGSMEYDADTDIRNILNQDIKKHRKAYDLALAGVPHKDIAVHLNQHINNVRRTLWAYKVGRYVL